MTRNGSSAAWSGRAKQRALDTYAQMAPTARNAGVAARQGADVVVAWASPRVRDARVWAAPRVEQAGYAVRDQVAPAVTAALVEASRRLDDSRRPKRSRWPWMLAGIGLLAAAGSAVAAIMLKRQPEAEAFGAEDQTADSAMPGTDAGYAQPSGEAARGQANGGADAEESAANGRMRTP
jgi:hypothetical protein